MSARAFTEAEVILEFADALAAAGFRLQAPPIMDGRWHRAAVEGDRGRKASGRYRGYLDGRPAGFIENFKDPSRSGRWRSGASLAEVSQAERDRIAARQAAREREFAARLDTIAREATAAWERAEPAPADHPYLARKGIAPHGARLDRSGGLLVPMFDFAGRLRDLQRIRPDGTKRFSTGGRVQGLHLLLGELRGDAPALLIAEGWATSATLHAATGHAVAVAFSKSNFAIIARTYRERVPGLRIVFAGDNDHHHPRRPTPLPNVGREAAEAAQREAGDVVALPEFAPADPGTDWNDYAGSHGPEAVRAAIEAALAAPAVPVEPPAVTPARPHYPAPTQSRQEALAALQREAGDFFTQAARHAAIQRDWRERQTEIDTAYPTGAKGRRRALKAARTAMADQHGEGWDKPGRRLLLPAPAGSGKTALAARLIRTAPGVVQYLSPTLRNAEDLAAQVPGAVVVRGRSAPDPDNPGNRMCLRHEAAEAVARAGMAVSTTLCRNDAGEVCPLAGLCGSMKQAARARSGEARVFAGSHEYAVHHGAMPAPDLVVVDESIVGPLVGRLEFGADRILPTEMPRWQEIGLPAATAAREVLAKVAEAVRDPASILAGLRTRGIRTPDDLEPARRYLRAVKDRDTAGISPTMDDGEVLSRLEQHRRSETGAVAKMLDALAQEIALPRDGAHGVEFLADKPVKVDGRTERQARVVVHYRKMPVFGADVPVLVLDASGDLEIYRRLFGDRLEVGAAVRCERNVEVVQVIDRTFARSTLTGTDRRGTPLTGTSVAKAERLREQVAAVTNALATRHGGLMLAGNKPVEDLLARALGEVVRTGHYGALRSRNDFQDLPAGMTIGREQLPPDAPEGTTRALFSDDPKPLHLPGAYVKQTRGIRMRDGSVVPVEVDVHPDPRVQRVLELARERETEQALDRLRLIHNVEPKTVYLVCNLPVDVTVDRAVTWAQLMHEATGALDNGVKGKGRRIYGDRLTEAWRRSGGALPLSRSELVRLFPDLWPSERRAREDLERWPSWQIEAPIAETATFRPVLVRYRRPGQRCPSLALVQPGDAGRAALEALVGPVVAYEVADASLLTSAVATALPEPSPPKQPSVAPPAVVAVMVSLPRGGWPLPSTSLAVEAAPLPGCRATVVSLSCCGGRGPGRMRAATGTAP